MERQEIEQGVEHILAFCDPGHRLHTHGVKDEQQCAQECRNRPQPEPDPQEHGDDADRGMKQHVDQVRDQRVKPKKLFFNGEAQARQGNIGEVNVLGEHGPEAGQVQPLNTGCRDKMHLVVPIEVVRRQAG